MHLKVFIPAKHTHYMNFYDLLKKRKSVRSYIKEKTVSWKEVAEIIDYANQVPLAGNIPTLNYIIVSEQKKIMQIADACQQGFLADVSAIIVVCSRKEQLLRNFEKKGEMFAHQEAGAAINNMLLAISEAGMASCWIGHFSDRIIKRLLKIPKEVEVEAIIPIGYEAPVKLGDRKKATAKPKIEDTLYFEEWDKNKRQ